MLVDLEQMGLVQYLAEGPILNKSMPEFASGS